MRKQSIIFILFFLVTICIIIIVSCTRKFNNPLDPESDIPPSFYMSAVLMDTLPSDISTLPFKEDTLFTNNLEDSLFLRMGIHDERDSDVLAEISFLDTTIIWKASDPDNDKIFRFSLLNNEGLFKIIAKIMDSSEKTYQDTIFIYADTTSPVFIPFQTEYEGVQDSLDLVLNYYDNLSGIDTDSSSFCYYISPDTIEQQILLNIDSDTISVVVDTTTTNFTLNYHIVLKDKAGNEFFKEDSAEIKLNADISTTALEIVSIEPDTNKILTTEHKITIEYNKKLNQNKTTVSYKYADGNWTDIKRAELNLSNTSKVMIKPTGYSFDEDGIYSFKIIVEDYGLEKKGRTKSIPSNIDTLTTIISYEYHQENQAPTIEPEPISPSSIILQKIYNLTLEWSCSDPENDDLTYEVFVDTTYNIDITDTTSHYRYKSTTDTIWILERKVDFAKTYYWKVVAKDGFNTTEGSIWEFTTEPNYAPVVSNILPENNATGISISGTDLIWTGSDDNGDPLTYDVYLDTISSPASLVSTGISNTTHSTGQLDPATTYYWKIVANDSELTNTSEVWHFTTTDSTKSIKLKSSIYKKDDNNDSLLELNYIKQPNK